MTNKDGSSMRNPIMKTGVIGGIVTYNPDISRLMDNIKAIRSQIDELIVVDNGSSNIDSVSSLCAKENCVLHANGENLGLSVALNSVMQIAENAGYGFVYLLDQDSVSSANVVPVLYDYCDRNIAICSPKIVDRNKLDRIQDSESLPPVSSFNRPITSGSLVSVEAWRKVDGFDESFFIDYIDYEFDERCLRAGYSLLQCNTVSLLQEGGHAEKSRLITGLLKGKDGQISFKHPYRYNYPIRRITLRYRNAIVFLRRYSDDPSFLYPEAWKLLRNIIHDITVEVNRIQVFRAILDGVKKGLESDPQDRWGLSERRKRASE